MTRADEDSLRGEAMNRAVSRADIRAAAVEGLAEEVVEILGAARRSVFEQEAIELARAINLLHFRGGGIHSFCSGSVTAYRPDSTGHHHARNRKLRAGEHLSSAILRAIEAVNASIGEGMVVKRSGA